jgi:hypothetical protein
MNDYILSDKKEFYKTLTRFLMEHTESEEVRTRITFDLKSFIKNENIENKYQNPYRCQLVIEEYFPYDYKVIIITHDDFKWDATYRIDNGENISYGTWED